MQTKVIEGVDTLPIDKKILSLIKKETDPFGPGIGFEVFGIRNKSGQIYRRIKTEGISETIGIVQGLERLGLVNEITAHSAPVERCTGVFALP